MSVRIGNRGAGARAQVPGLVRLDVDPRRHQPWRELDPRTVSDHHFVWTASPA
jgi:hypothetical protein